jgi:thiol:disulfide interchange protein
MAPNARIFAAMLAFAAVCAAGTSQAQQSSSPPIQIPPGAENASFVGGDYDPRIDPAPVLGVAKAIAKASNRRVLIEVGGDWCSWCHVLDKHVQGDPALQQAMAGSFVVLKVYWGFENQNKKVLGAFPKAAGYPHFYVLDADGNLLASQETEGFEKGQGYDSAKLIGFARKWDLPQ